MCGVVHPKREGVIERQRTVIDRFVMRPPPAKAFADGAVFGGRGFAVGGVLGATAAALLTLTTGADLAIGFACRSTDTSVMALAWQCISSSSNCAVRICRDNPLRKIRNSSG